MRNIIVAKTAGFCFGVDRAVKLVYAEAEKAEQEKSGPVYTYGPIIHNETVIDDLAAKGIKIINSEEELAGIKEGTVITRSHGVGESFYTIANQNGLKVVDATCPFVKKIHRIVKKASDEGDFVIVIGDEKHPEVIGICGWIHGPYAVVDTEEKLNALNLSGYSHITVVSQTTFNVKKFNYLVETIENLRYNSLCVNTICSSTSERQKEASELASKVDSMIVIGGKSSSNTRKLYEICKDKCEKTFLVQTSDDLSPVEFQSECTVGITAGASTPEHILKEVYNLMAEQTFEELLEGSVKSIHNGEVVSGKVIAVKEDEIVLNIGYKSDGIITRSEYTAENNADLTTMVNLDDEMEAKVIKVNDGEGQVLLSYRRLAADRGNKRLEEAFENQEVLTAPVTRIDKGGLSVTVEGTRVFIPASLVSDSYEKDLTKYEGQEIEFIIDDFKPRQRRIIGNRKKILVAKKKEMQKALFERIEPGMTVTGTVKNVTDFGAFIDLGGADGLLHISEMSWGRVENPKKVLSVGDEVTSFIKEINGNKIALSLKFDETNPWTHAAEKYAVGNVVEGRVARMTDFGAFVELEPGVDALLHVSQISRAHVEKPSDVLSKDQIITAKVVDFNEENNKISLSMKAIEAPQAAEE